MVTKSRQVGKAKYLLVLEAMLLTEMANPPTEWAPICV